MSEAAETIELKIEGMDCGHCVKTIETAVGGLPGVEEIKVSLTSNSAVIRLFPDKISRDAIVETIEDAGFDVPR